MWMCVNGYASVHQESWVWVLVGFRRSQRRSGLERVVPNLSKIEEAWDTPWKKMAGVFLSYQGWVLRWLVWESCAPLLFAMAVSSNILFRFRAYSVTRSGTPGYTPQTLFPGSRIAGSVEPEQET